MQNRAETDQKLTHNPFAEAGGFNIQVPKLSVAKYSDESGTSLESASVSNKAAPGSDKAVPGRSLQVSTDSVITDDSVNDSCMVRCRFPGGTHTSIIVKSADCNTVREAFKPAFRRRRGFQPETCSIVFPDGTPIGWDDLAFEALNGVSQIEVIEQSSCERQVQLFTTSSLSSDQQSSSPQQPTPTEHTQSTGQTIQCVQAEECVQECIQAEEDGNGVRRYIAQLESPEAPPLRVIKSSPELNVHKLAPSVLSRAASFGGVCTIRQRIVMPTSSPVNAGDGFKQSPSPAAPEPVSSPSSNGNSMSMLNVNSQPSSVLGKSSTPEELFDIDSLTDNVSNRIAQFDVAQTPEPKCSAPVHGDDVADMRVGKSPIMDRLSPSAEIIDANKLVEYGNVSQSNKVSTPPARDIKSLMHKFQEPATMRRCTTPKGNMRGKSPMHLSESVTTTQDAGSLAMVDAERFNDPPAALPVGLAKRTISAAADEGHAVVVADSDKVLCNTEMPASLYGHDTPRDTPQRQGSPSVLISLDQSIPNTNTPTEEKKLDETGLAQPCNTVDIDSCIDSKSTPSARTVIRNQALPHPKDRSGRAVPAEAVSRRSRGLGTSSTQKTSKAVRKHSYVRASVVARNKKSTAQIRKAYSDKLRKLNSKRTGVDINRSKISAPTAKVKHAPVARSRTVQEPTTMNTNSAESRRTKSVPRDKPILKIQEAMQVFNGRASKRVGHKQTGNFAPPAKVSAQFVIEACKTEIQMQGLNKCERYASSR